MRRFLRRRIDPATALHVELTERRAEVAERRAEVARLTETLQVCKVMIQERDARLDKLEALVKFHFGQSAYDAIRERDERITKLERLISEQETAARTVATDLWRQTERIEGLEAEVAALRAERKRETA